MAGIKDYSPVPASNTALFPEGMAPSAVNDGMRQVQADIRAEVASKGADIASAETVDLGAATGDFVDITGTTTIVSLGTVAAGIRRTVRFRGVLTLTHNATSLILPGGADITTADGDIARFRSLGAGSWVCEGYSRVDGTAVNDGNYAKLDAANVFTEKPTIAKTSGSAEVDLHAEHGTTGAIGAINFRQDDAAGTVDTLAQILAISSDLATGSQDAVMQLRAMIAGTCATRMSVGEGAWMEGATGGDPGAGKINAAGYQANGAALPFQKIYESPQQTITSAGSLTLVHGLGVQPKLYMAFLKCVTAEGGYSAGDEVNISNHQGTDKGVAIVPDATNLNIHFGAAPAVFNTINSSGVAASATNSRWRVIFRAWA